MKHFFSKLEIAILILFLMIIAAIVFLIAYPEVRRQDARDGQRFGDVARIIDAIYYDKIDNHRFAKEIDSAIVGAVYMLGEAKENCDSRNAVCREQVQVATQCLDLERIFKSKLPIAPSLKTNWDNQLTGYYLIKNADQSITVGACESESGEDIFITK